nr:hypothetical protein [Afifella marina]
MTPLYPFVAVEPRVLQGVFDDENVIGQHGPAGDRVATGDWAITGTTACEDDLLVRVYQRDE